jgi:predicted SnoaL-like aldol condensation-catalyzing enzyme
MTKKERIRQTLDAIFDQIFNQGKAELLPGLIGYIKQVGRMPCEVKRVAIDGDLAFVHVRYLDWLGQETAGVDIFRFDADGKIVEHWDVLQPVPATAKNANTMF